MRLCLVERLAYADSETRLRRSFLESGVIPRRLNFFTYDGRLRGHYCYFPRVNQDRFRHHTFDAILRLWRLRHNGRHSVVFGSRPAALVLVVL